MKDYADETTLQADSTGHTINELKPSIGGLVGIHFETPARRIMEQAHENQKLYIESEVEEKVSIVEGVNNLRIVQIMVVEDRGDRDPEAMHLVFEIIETDEEGEVIEEVIVQPEEYSGGSATYDFDMGAHFSVKTYYFQFEDFPSHQEYRENAINITAKHISAVGETELEVNWEEIR